MTTFGYLAIWGSALYHMIVGVPCMITIDFIRKVAKLLYGLNIPKDLDPRYEFCWKPLGSYAVFVSLVCFRAALVQDLSFQHFVVQLLVMLYLLRAACRFWYRDLFSRAFDVTFKRNLVNIVFNSVLAASMLLFSFKS